MKPPLRPRLAPARFVTGPGGAAAAEEAGPGPGERRAAWSVREKRALLAALRAQAALGLPEPQTGALRERLPRRSEAEIVSFLCRLRGRVAREAVSTQYRHCLEQQRRRRALLPAPIELWLELAETLAESLEEATAAAFSQVLTVAATEPLSLSCSSPPQPPLDKEGGPEGGDPPPAPPGGLAVDFQRVYEYLGQLCRGGRAPSLPPAESAVVLALLGSLPPELGALDCPALRTHFRGVYSTLTAPHPHRRDPSLPKTPPDPPEIPPHPSGAPPHLGTTPSSPPHPSGAASHPPGTAPPFPETTLNPPGTTPHPPSTASHPPTIDPTTPAPPGTAPAPARPPPTLSPWRGVGLSPLNLFLVPLRLLGRAGTPPGGE